MPRKRHTPEQIIGKLREAEVGLANGQTVLEVCRAWESLSRRTIAGARNTAEGRAGEALQGARAGEPAAETSGQATQCAGL